MAGKINQKYSRILIIWDCFVYKKKKGVLVHRTSREAQPVFPSH